MAIPDINRFRDPTGRVGFVPKRSNGNDGQLIQYDEGLDEWSIDGDRLITESELSSGGGLLEAGDDINLDTNPSTGNTRISVEDIVDFDQVILSTNQTKDTSGDIQIRDDSGGNLFSLNDGNDPQVSAKHEGSGAFTFGRINTRSNAGDYSFAAGDRNVATGIADAAFGRTCEATGGLGAFAAGLANIAQERASFSVGEDNLTNGRAAVSIGHNVVSRVRGGVAVGSFNEDYLGSGGSNALSAVSSDDRMFAVGVGDAGDDPGGIEEFDGRGRVDGLYVTMREGTYIRHGLSVDGYNSSTGQYETVFEVDETGTITKGSVSVDGSNLDAAGPEGAIQFNNNDSFDGVSNFTYDPSVNELTIKGNDATISNNVPGLFSGFLDPVTKILFPFETFTEKSDIPTVSGFPSLATVQGGFSINQSTNETLDFGNTSFYYPFASEIDIDPDNSQGYVDFGSTENNITQFATFSRFNNIKAQDIGIWGTANTFTINGDETEINLSNTGNAVIGTQSFFTLEDDISIDTLIGFDSSFSLSNFSGNINNLYGIQISTDETVINGSVDKFRGIQQSNPLMENYFEGSLIQSSGGLVTTEDNRNIEYSLNQRTTDEAQKTLKIDSQGVDIVPDAQNEATWEFSGKVVARVESGNPSKTSAIAGDSHVWEFEGVFTSRVENASLGTYNVEFIGQPVVSTIASNQEVEDYSVDITKNDDGELLINVTGEEGATVNWSGKLEVMELVA